MIAVGCLLIQQRGGLLRVEAEGRLEAVPLACKVIMGLLHVRQEGLIAVIDGSAVLAILEQLLLQFPDDIPGRRLVCLTRRTKGGPAEMRSQMRMRPGHRADRFGLVVALHVFFFELGGRRRLVCSPAGRLA